MTEPKRSPQNSRTKGVLLGAAVGLLIGLILAAAAYRLAAPGGRARAAEDGPKAYQCPMHPQIIQDYFGSCPICGMDLVVMEGSQSLMSPGPEGMVTVQIDAQRRQLMGLRTVPAEVAPLGGELRAPARLVAAEPGLYRVTVKTPGYVERLLADFTGKAVKKGDLLLEIYSPDFLTAQKEYAVAIKTIKALRAMNDAQGQAGQAGDGGQTSAAQDNTRWGDLVAAARRRLEYLDAPQALLDALDAGGEPARCLQVLSPVSGVVTAKNVVQGGFVSAMETIMEIADLSLVWALADLYETDVARVKVGGPATLDVPALGTQAKGLKGRVVFIDPVVDPGTRTLKARLEFPNLGGLLRPEMIGSAAFGMGEAKALTIPLDAVLDSGHRKIVFVDATGGYFEPREIEVGRVGGGRVEVLDGLEPGEAVVTRAAFLLDSESRLQAALAELGRRAAEKKEHDADHQDHQDHPGH
jgi:Cu(I)/Ag(I) efflux system membrane fusion protein